MRKMKEEHEHEELATSTIELLEELGQDEAVLKVLATCSADHYPRVLKEL